MVDISFLENCPIQHIYGKVIKDNENNIIDFDIIHTKLKNQICLEKRIIDYIKQHKYWKEILREVLSRGSLSVNVFVREVNYYVTVDLQRENVDHVILWLSKEAENDSRKETIFEMVCDSMPDAIYYKDIDGIYIYCNKNYADMLRLTKNEIIGKRDRDLHILKSFDKDIAEIDRGIMKSGEPKTYCATMNYLDGEVVDFETKKTPYLDENNKCKGIIGITRNINHRKEEQKELEKLRMQFFANLSHEFRTPINLIFSSLQLIEVLSKNEDRENINRKYLDIIKQNSFRLSKLVNNLIDSTKISSGYFNYSPQNHDVISFIENICTSVAQYASQKDIEIIFDTEVEEKIIAFDLNLIERIVLNLLSNAIKFSESNGQIYINIMCKEGYIEVNIKDEGIGIPEDKLEYVFEMFKQVNNRMTKISEGSGIGLSLVKSLVEMHGGYVEVKSKLNKGSEFTFALPDIIVDQTLNQGIDNSLAENTLVETIKIEFSDIY